MAHRPRQTASTDPDTAVAKAVEDYLADRPGAGDRLAMLLDAPLRAAASGFLGPDHGDLGDVVQDSSLAVLEHLQRRGEWSGNLVAFAVTVARNRCRNILNWQARWPHTPVESLETWLADPDRDPLDLLAESDLHRTLQDALDNLREPCGMLLRGFYLEGLSAHELRRRLGLTTVQGVYYRRDSCLAEALIALKKRLSICSPKEDDPGNKEGTS